MKTNQFIIALWLMAAGVALAPRTGLAKPVAPVSAADPSTFEQELANYLQAVQLRNALERGAVVVVSFSLDKQQRVQNEPPAGILTSNSPQNTFFSPVSTPLRPCVTQPSSNPGAPSSPC